MNELINFMYGDKPVRTIQTENGPMFVLKDVCEVLGLSNSTVVAQRLDSDEVTKFDLGGLSGETNVVTESGLYNVILRSDKPEARDFKRWVTHEVLPSIRKHGAYMTPETLQAAILNPDTMIRLCQQLKTEQDKNRELLAQNSELAVDRQIMQPKADYFDQIVERNLLTNMRETAKQFEISPRQFVEFLLKHKYLYHDKKGKLLPYEDKNNGLFEVKECFNEKTQWSGTQTLITPKGRETFRLLCQGIT